MIDSIQNILVQVSDFLWSYIIITVLICCALFFTWRTRFVQFRLIRGDGQAAASSRQGTTGRDRTR